MGAEVFPSLSFPADVFPFLVWQGGPVPPERDGTWAELLPLYFATTALNSPGFAAAIPSGGTSAKGSALPGHYAEKP